MKAVKRVFAAVLAFAVLVGIIPSGLSQSLPVLAATSAGEEAGVRLYADASDFDDTTNILTVSMQIKLPEGVNGITSFGSMITYDTSGLTLYNKDGSASTVTPSETVRRSTTSIYDPEIDNLVNVDIKSANNVSYTADDVAIYGSGSSASLVVNLSPGAGYHSDQATTDWQNVYTLKFLVDDAYTLDSDSIRFANATADITAINSMLGAASENGPARYSVYYDVSAISGGDFIANEEIDGNRYYHNLIDGNVGSNHFSMSAPGTGLSIIPGGHTMPTIPVVRVAINGDNANAVTYEDGDTVNVTYGDMISVTVGTDDGSGFNETTNFSAVTINYDVKDFSYYIDNADNIEYTNLRTINITGYNGDTYVPSVKYTIDGTNQELTLSFNISRKTVEKFDPRRFFVTDITLPYSYTNKYSVAPDATKLAALTTAGSNTLMIPEEQVRDDEVYFQNYTDSTATEPTDLFEIPLVFEETYVGLGVVSTFKTEFVKLLGDDAYKYVLADDFGTGSAGGGTITLTTADQPLETEYTIDNPYQIRLGNTISFAEFTDAVLGEFKGDTAVISSASSNLGIDNTKRLITAISENSAPIEVVIKSLAMDGNSDDTDEYRETDISVYVDVVPKDPVTIPFKLSGDAADKLTFNNSNIDLEDIGYFDYDDTGITDQTIVDALTESTKYYAADDAGAKTGDALAGPPKDAGKYIVEVSHETETNIYSGSQNFTINPFTLTDENITFNISDEDRFRTFNGKEQVLTVGEVYVDLYNTPNNADDDIVTRINFNGINESTSLTSILRATVAGNYSYTVIGENNFTGKASLYWSIEPLVITKDNTEVLYTDQNGAADGTLTYNKNPQSQRITLKFTNGTPEETDDFVIDEGEYYISRESQTDAGDYLMGIEGGAKGNVTGTLTDIPWTIEKADVAITTFRGTKPYNGKTDLEGLSFSIIGLNWDVSGVGVDVFPGTDPVFGTDYTVSGTLSSQYVAARNINDFKIVPSVTSDYFDNFNIIYNGSSFIAEVTAVEQPITVNSSNDSTNSQSNPYILKINSEHTITDLFEGEIGAVKNVTISNADSLELSVSADKSTILAGGVFGETVAKVDVNFAAVNVDNSGNDEYLETTKTIYVKVIDKNPVDATATARDKTYDGNAYDPNMFVTVTGIPAGLTKTYTYYERDIMSPVGVPTKLPGAPTIANIDGVKEYIVEVTAEDADNRYTASDTFKINPFELTSANTTITLGSDLVYNTTEQTRDFDVTVTGFDNVTYNINSGSDKGTDAGDYTLSITGTGNFKGTVTKAWEIEKLPVTVKSFKAAKDYDKTTSLNGLSVTELLFASDIPDDHSYILTTNYTISGTLTSANGGTGIGISNFSITPVANTELANYDISISETAGTVDVTIDKIALPDGYSITSDTVDIIYNRAITDMPFSIDLEFPADSGTIKYDPLNVSILGDTVGFRGVDIATKTSNNMIEVTYDGTQTSSGGSMKYIIPFETQNYIIPNNYELIINFVEKYSTDVEVTGKTEVTYGDADFTLGKSAKIPGEGVGVWSFESSDTDVLEVDSTTGKVTIVGAGSATITASYESDTHKGSDTINITVAKKTISFSGVTVHDKEYDGNTTATYDESGLTVTGLVTSLDSLGIDGLRFIVEEATFDNKNAGTNKTVTVIYNLTATVDVSSIEVRRKISDYFSDYIFIPTTTHKATIEKKGLTATEGTGVIFSKYFDGTTDISSGSYANAVTFDGVVTGESIDFSQYTKVGFKYDNADAGTDKTVTGSIKLTKTAITDNYYLINSDLTYLNQEIIAIDSSFGLPPVIYVTDGTLLSEVTFDTTFIGVDGATESGTLSFTRSGTPITDYTFTGAVGTSTFIDYTFTPNNSNYLEKIGNILFPITDKTPIFVTVEDVEITYGDTFDWGNDLKITAKTADGTDVTGSYREGDGSYPNFAGAGVVGIIFTPDESETYAEATAIVRYVINKAKITGTPTFTKVSEAGKTLTDITVDLSGIAPSGAVFKWENPDETIIEQGVSYNYEINIFYVGAAHPDFNYETLTGSVVLWENSAVTPPPVNQFTITASAGEGGTISPSGSVSVLTGATPTFTITPNAGYEIEGVIIDESVTLNVSSYTFAAIDASHSIRATFRLATTDNTDDDDDSSSQGTGNEGDEDDGTDGTDGDGTGDEGDSEDDSSSSSSGTAADNATDVSVTLPSTDKEITSVTVGSETLTENDYTIEGGNLIISEEFIKNLSVGEHTVTVNYEDESYTATIEISDSSAPISSGNFIPAEPEDEGGSMLPIVLVVVGLAVAGGVVFFIIRKKNAPAN